MFVVTTFRITPCGASLPPNGSVSLLGIRSFGYAIDCTSTTPGLMYATPRLVAIYFPFLCELLLANTIAARRNCQHFDSSEFRHSVDTRSHVKCFARTVSPLRPSIPLCDARAETRAFRDGVPSASVGGG